MLDNLKHECGIAMIRFKKPLSFYKEKFNTDNYAINKMYLLMEKQHNRGQDGAGIANINIDLPPGKRYIFRSKSADSNPLLTIFRKIKNDIHKVKKINKENYKDLTWRKENCPYMGEMWLGHLRYGTFGKNDVENCHPIIRKSNWRSKNLALAGNFNMTNVDHLFKILIELGQHPKKKIDTVTILEKIGHFLDEEIQRIFDEYKHDKRISGQGLSHIIEEELDLGNILRPSFKDFDGGYAIAGVLGHGTSFVIRDPNGIRPAYYYEDDMVTVVASEKPAIKTTFNIEYGDIKSIPPGNALIINKSGDSEIIEVLPPQTLTSCSFERIYFSRGTDPDIYMERKEMGRLLFPQLYEAVQKDLTNTVFSYIPNTAETSFLGLLQSVDDYISDKRKKAVFDKNFDKKELDLLLSFKPRIEKLVMKDAKIRTFITNDNDRNELVAHIYDTTYEVINKGVDNLAILDDSIVRGVTLRERIITLLDRLEPKRIIVISAAPQLRYPDCYGIDISKIGDLIAFQAAIALLKENGKEKVIQQVYDQCKNNIDNPNQVNYVKEIYAPFTVDQISKKIATLVTKSDIKAAVTIVYQTEENLRKAVPEHKGDWYFSGNYPTKGGIRVVNKAFTNYFENKGMRAY